MRAHLLHVVDIDSHCFPTNAGDLPASANDTTYDVSGVALTTTMCTLADARTAGLKPVSSAIAKADDDAYWLGGYAGI